MSSIDFDKVLVMIGERGRYQSIMFFILCIPATIPVAFLAFSNVFTNATPDHWCRPSPEFKNLNISTEDLKFLTLPHRIRGDGVKIYEKCLMYNLDFNEFLKFIANNINYSSLHPERIGNVRRDEFQIYDGSFEDASIDLDKFEMNDEWKRRFEEFLRAENVSTRSCRFGWEYDQRYYDSTLVTELDLVCENGTWPQTSTAMFYVGSIFGNVIFGWVADRWGRRNSILWMIFLEVIVSIVTSFSSNYVTYMVLRALGGLFFPALYQIPFVLGIEMMGPSHRTFAGMIICMFFAGAMSLLSLLAYLLRDWFKLSIATSVPFVLLFSYYWIIPESPRWLLSRGRLDEAEEIVQTIAKFNGNAIPERLLHKLQDESTKTPTLLPQENLRRRLSSLNYVNGFVTKNEENYRESKSLEYDKLNSNDRQINLPKSRSQEIELLPDNKIPVEQSRKISKRFTYPSVSFLKQDEVEDGNDVNKQKYKKEFKGAQKEKDALIGDRRMSSEGARSQNEILPNLKYLRSPSRSVENKTVSSVSEEATMLDIFRYPNIRKKFFFLTFNWIANGVVYNGLSYNVTKLGVNDFLAFFIAAAIEIPSYLLAWKLMDRWGRRWVLSGAMAIGGLGCISCMLVPEEKVWITVTLAMIGKFGIAASFSVFYVFVGESFPTVLRSQAMGLASLLVSVGLLTFPYILQLDRYYRTLPFMVLGLLSLLAAITSIFLPETLNMPMPETLLEGEQFGKDCKVFSLPARIPENPT